MLFPVLFYSETTIVPVGTTFHGRIAWIVLGLVSSGHLPTGVRVSIPAELSTAFPAGFPFTPGDVLAAVSVLPQQFQAVSSVWIRMAASHGGHVHCPSSDPGHPAGCRPKLQSLWTSNKS
jgi:hypothetical protein